MPGSKILSSDFDESEVYFRLFELGFITYIEKNFDPKTAEIIILAVSAAYLVGRLDEAVGEEKHSYADRVAQVFNSAAE